MTKTQTRKLRMATATDEAWKYHKGDPWIVTLSCGHGYAMDRKPKPGAKVHCDLNHALLTDGRIIPGDDADGMDPALIVEYWAVGMGYEDGEGQGNG